MISTLTELTISAEHRYLSLVDAWIAAFVDRLPDSLPAREVFSADLVLATHEVVANQIDHAYQGGAGRISLSIELEAHDGAIVVQVQDWGQPLDVKALAGTIWQDTSHGQQLVSVQEPEWDQVRGRGLFLIHTLTNRVLFQARAESNVWTLIKFIKQQL